jgi:catechol 2,3-dioxygenase-like lactoylglutathione lyase family enzyme
MYRLSEAEVGASIAVSDIDRARRFYEAVLGLVPDTDSGDNIAYRCAGGTRINIFVSPHAGTARSTQAGWRVDDMDAAVDALVAQGVAFERYDRGPILTDDRGVASFAGGNQVAYFADPDGNILSIAYAPASSPSLGLASVATRLPAQDLERAATWYRDKLGLEPAETRPGGLRYEVGPNTFVLFASQGRASGDHTQMAFDVGGDLERVVRELQRRGVEFDDVDAPGLRTVDQIADIEGNYPSKGRAERGAWFRDSEGNLIGIGESLR